MAAGGGNRRGDLRNAPNGSAADIAGEDWSEIALVTHWGFIRALTGLKVPNGAVLRIDPTRLDRPAEMLFVPDG